jgi:hypothetical protein
MTTAGSAATLLVEHVVGGSPVLMVLGLTNAPLPIAGGILVPGEPRYFVAGLTARADGTSAVPIAGRAGHASSVYVQAVALAGTEVQFSNAVELVIGVP